MYLLMDANDAKDGMIMITNNLSRLNLEVNGKNLTEKQELREIAKWESSIAELISFGFIKQTGTSGEILKVTADGYEYIEQAKDVEIR